MKQLYRQQRRHRNEQGFISFHFMSSQSQPSHHSEAGDALKGSPAANPKAEQGGCRQRLIDVLLCIHSLYFAVA